MNDLSGRQRIAVLSAWRRLKGNSSLRSVSDEADPTDLPWLIRLDEFVLVTGSIKAQRAHVFAPPTERQHDLTADAQSHPTATTGPASTIDTSSR